MNVLLMERIANLGELGDVVSVRNGYARNFLIPKGMAMRSTPENRKIFEDRRAELEQAAIERLEGAEQRAALLDDRVVTIVARVGDEGHLYGSVGTQEIAEALTDAGVAVHKSEVRMPSGAIRETGEYQVDIQVYADMVRAVTVLVDPE